MASNDDVNQPKSTSHLLSDELMPMSNLRPDSLEFKKRINEESFWYFMELTDIYMANAAYQQDRKNEERNRSAVLVEYHNQLEQNKKFFESLALLDKSAANRLILEALKKIELLDKKLDASIFLLNDQIKLVNEAIVKLDTHIQKLSSETNQHTKNLANILRDYASQHIPIKNAKRILVPLHFNKDEIDKMPPNSVNHLVLNEDTIRKIINHAADKISKEEFSFENQSNNMQDIAKEVLRHEILDTSSFLPIDQREKIADRFMNTEDAASAIQALAMLVNDHIEHMEANNGYQFKSEQIALSTKTSELNDAVLEKDHLIQMRKELESQKDTLGHLKDKLHESPRALSSKSVDQISDSLDDIFGTASKVQAALTQSPSSPEDKKEEELSHGMRMG